MTRVETRIKYFYIDSLEALSVFAIMSVVAGLVFRELRQQFIEFPSLLALVPPLLGTAGNIIATFSSRLASLLNTGRIEPSLSDIFSREVALNIVAALIQSLIMAAVLGTAVHFVLILFGSESLGLFQNIAVSLFALFLLALFLTFVMSLIIFFGTRYGLDPDTLAGPFATGLADISAIIFLYAAATFLAG